MPRCQAAPRLGNLSAMKLTPGRALLFGTLTVATLDILDAIIFWGVQGAPPIRIFQGIARGFLGRPSFEGGIPTALLGACIHVFISFCVVTVYYIASGRFGFLERRPFVSGLLYGLIVYLFMYRVVIPLSAIHAARSTPIDIANQLFAHLFLVGLPSALFASAARSEEHP